MHLNDIAFDQWALIEQLDWHNKTPLECLALICSEVGEAANECRGAEPTERLGEELADIILRTLDLAAELDYNIEQLIADKQAKLKHIGTRGRLK